MIAPRDPGVVDVIGRSLGCSHIAGKHGLIWRPPSDSFEATRGGSGKSASAAPKDGRCWFCADIQVQRLISALHRRPGPTQIGPGLRLFDQRN